MTRTMTVVSFTGKHHMTAEKSYPKEHGASKLVMTFEVLFNILDVHNECLYRSFSE